MKRERNWTVLCIGGASGVGKSRLAYDLADYYKVNVIEVDDICQSIKAMTTREILPSLHYWSNDVNWMDIGVNGNVKWLIDVSKEMIPGIKAVVENHIESDMPVIIEGDFICPEFAKSFADSKVKCLFVHEPDKEQIVKNYHSREGGELQDYRADISGKYGKWLKDSCRQLGNPVIESRPWDTVVERAVKCLMEN